MAKLSKRKIFMVTGIRSNEFIEKVVCADSEIAVYAFLATEDPALSVQSVTSLARLEARAKKILAVISGEDTSCGWSLDPAMSD